MHVHVSHPDGEAKFWLTPTIELANHIGLSSQQLREVMHLVNSHIEEIVHAWRKHFDN